MAGKRMVHDKICESRKVNSVDLYAECLWIRLMTKADDNGNYFRDVRRVHANCMLEKPGASEKLTEKAIISLIKTKLLHEYEADGRRYVHIADFHEHQELPGDRYCKIEHPVHPPEMGGAYTGEGLRRDVWQDQSRSCSGAMAEERRRINESIDNNNGSLEGKIPTKNKVKYKEEVEGDSASAFEFREGNFNKFRECWKDAAGRATKPKPYPKSVERYQELCRRFGEDEVLEAIDSYVKLHGKHETGSNKWAEKDFLFDECEDLINHKREGRSVSVDGAANRDLRSGVPDVGDGSLPRLSVGE